MESQEIQKLFEKEIFSSQIEDGAYMYAVFFLYEQKKGEKSEWFNLINLLDKNNYDHFPTNFDDNDLRELEGTNLLDRLKNTISNHEDAYLKILNNLEDFDQFSFDQFQKFVTIFTAHVFKGIQNFEKTFLIIPYFDQFNHSKKPNMKLHFNSNGNVEGLMLNNTQIGEEILIDYAHKITGFENEKDEYDIKNHDEIFVYYGFIDEEKKMDSLWTNLTLNDSVPFYNDKKKLWETSEKKNGGVYFNMNQDSIWTELYQLMISAAKN